jgi:mono/diheme cytochrome c family protein
LLATLSGSGTSGATFRWQQVSGPPIALPLPAAAATAFAAPPVGGTHVFSLVAFSGGVPSGESFAVVEVDHVPIAVAGESRVAAAGATVTLDGTDSFDLDEEDDLTFGWTQVAGDAVVLSDALSPAPVFTAPLVNQVLAFELRVHDGVAESIADRVVVGVGAGLPVADAGRPSLVPLDDTVHLSAARSVPANGGVAGTFAWTAIDLGSGAPALENATTASPSFLAPRAPGRYLFQVVSDGESASFDRVLVVVTRSVADGRPRAAAGPRQTVATGAPFSLTSGDPQGHLRAHEWRQVAGADAGLTGSGATRNGTAPSTPDVLQFLLMVHDGLRYGPPDLATVLSGSPAAPVADAGPDRSGSPGQAITLSGSGVPSTGRAITGYSWVQTSGLDFYDVAAKNAGFDPSVAAPAFVVPASLSSLNPSRAITFALTVTDDIAAGSLPDTVVVNLTNLPANAGPEVMAGASATLVRPGTGVSLLGTASDADSDPLAISWTLVSGPVGVTILNASTLDASFTAPAVSGAYQFRLRADDGTGTPNAVGQDLVTVTVNVAPSLDLVVASPTSGPEGTPVTLSASGVEDPDGDTLSFAWTERNPPGGSAVTLSGADTDSATFTMPAYSGSIVSRTRTFRVTVTDLLGAQTKDVTFVPNGAPVLGTVQSSATKIRYDGATTAILSAPGTSDPDGDAVTLTWTVLTGPTVSQSLLSAATGSPVGFRVPAPSPATPSRGGIYTIEAVASDGALQAAPGTVQVLAYPSWASDVYPIISANCASCHGANGGLTMSSAALAYANLRNMASVGSALLRVKPNDATNSYMYFRVNTGQMPAGGPKLSQHLIDVIRDWIEPDRMLGVSGFSAGAENN